MARIRFLALSFIDLLGAIPTGITGSYIVEEP